MTEQHEPDLVCPECQSEQVEYEALEGTYSCATCGCQWAHSGEAQTLEQWANFPSNTLTLMETGTDAEGKIVMRFMTDLPGDTQLDNGYTIDQLYEALKADMEADGTKLVRD